MEKERTHTFGIRLRAILIGLILIPFNCYWVTITEIKWCSNDSTCVSLFMTVVFILFVLTLVNVAVARRYPRLALNQGELMVVYVMLSVSTAMGGHDMMGNLLPNITNVFWFDNPQNNWEKFHRYIPQWFAVRDKSILKGFYEGNSTLYTKEHILAWLTPVTTWGTFMIVIAFTMLCINVLIRKQWSDRDRLSFPIIQMPLEMTRVGGRSGFFSNRILWLGFAIPVVLETMNNLNFFYPSVPYVQIKVYDIGQFIANRPWNGVGWMPISFYPFAIGLTFFLPADLSFSCWFFYVFRKMLDVLAVAMGWRDAGASPAMQRFPYFAEQADGAWIMLAGLMIYAGRNYFRQVVRRALGKESELDDSTEPMSYRTALLGSLLGFAALCTFTICAGASPFVPLIFFALYFIVCIAITRIRAELGPPAHELNFYRPEEIMNAVFGTQSLGIRNLTIMSYFYWFNRGYRNLVMPHQLEAFKISEVTRSSGRKFALVIMVAVFLGVVSTFWSLLHMYYINGAATAKIAAGYRTGIGSYAFDRLNGWVLNPKKPDTPAIMAILSGGTFALFLSVMKSRFLWWPFHPIGYGLAVSYAMDYFWFTAFIGWMCKALTLRYGGIKAYRTFLPFFMGLILGDYVIASTWTLIGWVLGVPVYRQFIF